MLKHKTSLLSLALAVGLGIPTSSLSAMSLQDRELTSADILCGYTATVKNRRGGDSQVRAAIRQGFARANKANKDSRTGAYYANVAMLEFDYDDSSGDLLSHFQDWRANRTGTSRGRDKSQWANDRFADLFVFYSRGGGARGWGGGVNGAVTESQIQFHTTGHEIGHCYGCTHAAGHEMATSSGARFTFMKSGGQSNSRIVDLYSNPFVRYQGQYTAGIQPSRYNALKIANDKFNKANRRTGLWSGGIVSFKSNTNYFASSENGNLPMSASRPNIFAWERFNVSRNNNRWVFKGNNNRYVSSENGSNSGMNCNRTRIGSWERFELSTSNGQISLKGVGGYVSGNGSTGNRNVKMTANRSSIGAQERWYVHRP